MSDYERYWDLTPAMSSLFCVSWNGIDDKSLLLDNPAADVSSVS
jgi:hypothetical protein